MLNPTRAIPVDPATWCGGSDSQVSKEGVCWFLPRHPWFRRHPSDGRGLPRELGHRLGRGETGRAI